MRLENPALIETDEQIDWLLSRSNVSTWLKNALAAARGRDPVELLSDLSILDCVLRSRCTTQLRTALDKYEQGAA
ncbi:hypothetical protein [Aquamicrobium soli]|jgi:hypothetical protein|uniref:Antitoxin Xre/MbcA/ParS-like toxin-binding domain-containing protein n=1 Tax=Aquamicrobium soli TaxID=1811518 RepID=A0ABV7K7J8_9HYPH